MPNRDRLTARCIARTRKALKKADARLSRGQAQKAVDILAAARRDVENTLGADSHVIFPILLRLAEIHYAAGDGFDALFRQAVAITRSPAWHPEHRASAFDMLSETAANWGDRSMADNLDRLARAEWAEVYATFVHDADDVRMAGAPGEAAERLAQAAETIQRHLGEAHRVLGYCQQIHAMALGDTGRHEEAGRLLRRCIATYQSAREALPDAVVGPADPKAAAAARLRELHLRLEAGAQLVLAIQLELLASPAEAARQLRHAIEVLEAAGGSSIVASLAMLRLQAAALIRRDDPGSAARLCVKVTVDVFRESQSGEEAAETIVGAYEALLDPATSYAPDETYDSRSASIVRCIAMHAAVLASDGFAAISAVVTSAFLDVSRAALLRGGEWTAAHAELLTAFADALTASSRPGPGADGAGEAAGEPDPRIGLALDEALGLFRSIEDHRAAAYTIERLANLAKHEDREEAVRLLGEAVEELRLASPAVGSAELAGMIIHRAEGLALGEHADQAIPPLQEALAIIARLKDVDPEVERSTVDALRLLGFVYFRVGQHEASLEAYETLVATIRRVPGSSDPRLAEAISLLAAAHAQVGNIVEAERLEREYESHLRASDRPEDPKRLIGSLFRSTNLRMRLGDRFGAVPLFSEAMALQKDAISSEGKAGIHDADWFVREYAARLARDGDPDAARSVLQQLREGARDDARIDWLLQEARLLEEAGNPLGALGIVDQAIEVATGAASADLGQLVSSAHHYRGKLLLGLDRRDEAEKALRTSVALADREPSGLWRVDDARSTLIDLLIATARPADALAVMREQEALSEDAIHRVNAGGSDRTRLAFLRNRTDAGLGRFVRTVATHFRDDPTAVREAFELTTKRKGIALELERDRRRWQRSRAGPEARALQSRIDLLATRLGQLVSGDTDAFAEIRRLRSEKDALEEELAVAGASAGAMPAAGGSQRTLEEVARALPADAVLIDFVLAGMDPGPGAVLCAFVLHANEPESLTLVRLGDPLKARMRAESFRRRVSEAETRSHDERDEFGNGEGGGAPHENTTPGLEQRDVLIRERRIDSADDTADAGLELRRQLFDPLVPFVREKTRLVISPEGYLTQVCFQALPADDGGYLIDRYEISYLSVTRQLLEQVPDRAGQRGAALVIADPDFDSPLFSRREPPADALVTGDRPPGTPSRVRFSRLRGTREEGIAVHAIIGGRLLLGPEATESALKAAESPSVLHLATHGFFLPAPASMDHLLIKEAVWLSGRGTSGAPELKKDSGGPSEENGDPAAPPNAVPRGTPTGLHGAGIVLAGVNVWLADGSRPEDPDDGVLTTEDVASLDLQHTDMVVLSACDTGRAEVDERSAAVGVFGLRRSFHLAGARSLVMSLWKVPDHETCALMRSFYRRLKAGERRSAALRAAQLEIRETRPAPFYWAAFVCEGDAGELTA